MSFCILTSYPATLLYLVISSRNFLAILLDFLHRRSCHLQTKTVLCLPSQSVYLLIFFLPYYISKDLKCSVGKHTQGQWFALYPPLSYRSKKSCGFFSLFSFFLVVRMEWRFSSSLHADPETRSLLTLFWYFCHRNFSCWCSQNVSLFFLEYEPLLTLSSWVFCIIAIVKIRIFYFEKLKVTLPCFLFLSFLQCCV